MFPELHAEYQYYFGSSYIMETYRSGHNGRTRNALAPSGHEGSNPSVSVPTESGHAGFCVVLKQIKYIVLQKEYYHEIQYRYRSCIQDPSIKN